MTKDRRQNGCLLTGKIKFISGGGQKEQLSYYCRLKTALDAV
jgi:hypothetical protein